MTDPEQPGTVREGGSDMNIRNGRIHDDMILIEPAKIRQRVGLLKYQKISNPGKAGQVSSRYVRGSLARRGEAASFILFCTRVTSSSSTTGASDCAVTKEADIAGQPLKSFCHLNIGQEE